MNTLAMHRQLLKCRRAEELLARLYKQQEMRTPMHLGVGQEAISVGVCAALNLPHDAVFTHHRSHLAYLACGGDFEKLAAELYGRETGCAKGRGGSVHLTARETGFIASSAILGQMIAVATGAALAFKMDRKPNVAVCFFGEAALEEGVSYEAMNYAAIHKLPVLFVCENNLYSTESPLSVRAAYPGRLCQRPASLGIVAMKIDGNDVGEVNKICSGSLMQIREGMGPMFLECMTYRHLEHVGPNYDHEMNRTYRTEQELREWQSKDPLKRSRDALIAQGAKPEELEVMDLEITAELEAAAQRAYAAPSPDKSKLLEHVW